MTSRKNGTLYVGVTNDLVKRVYQHKNGITEGFTSRYQVHLLVWFEAHPVSGGGDPQGEADEELEAGVEDCIDREGQSWLAGLVRDPSLDGEWIPGQARDDSRRGPR